MNSIRKLLTALILVFWLIVFSSNAQTTTSEISRTTSIAPIALQGTDVSSLRTLSDDQLTAFVNALDALPTLATTSLPRNGLVGSFWSLQHPEWPPLPMDGIGANVWPLSGSDGGYLLDDVSVNYDAISAANSSRHLGMMLEDDGGMYPPGYDGSDTNVYTPEGLLPPPDYGTNLYLAQFQLTNGFMTGIASNTLADVEYSLLTNVDLTTTNWMPLTPVIFGSELTNWTSLGLLPFNPTNNLFFRLRSEASSDGSGLPDWWEQLYFGTNGVDPYGNPAGDGWNNLQKYQNGWNPNQFYTPATPQGFTASYDPITDVVTLNWLSAAGSVTNYTITDNHGHNTTISASATSATFELTNLQPFNLATSGPNADQGYRIQAGYTDGASSVSDWAGFGFYGPNVPIYLIPAGNGSANLSITKSALPPDTATVRLTRIDEWDAAHYQSPSVLTNFDIPLSAFTDGIYAIPAAWQVQPVDAYQHAEYAWWGETLNADNGPNSQSLLLSSGYNFTVTNGWVLPPFFDGRIQLKQNLVFLLRAAVADSPFLMQEFYSDHTITTSYPYDYVYAGFYQYDDYHNVAFDQFLPFIENYEYRNFAFNLSDLNSDGSLVGLTNSEFVTSRGVFEPAPYQFQPPATNQTSITALLDTNTVRWLDMGLAYDAYTDEGTYGYENYSEIGILISGYSSAANKTMSGTSSNLFGLPFVTAKVAWGNTALQTATLSPGDSTTNALYFYSEVAQPKFRTDEYDFWDPAVTVLPGDANFQPTNSTLRFFTEEGIALNIVGYAKLEVTNSAYTGVYGYLGQYFDTAYKIDDNGNVTTNQTGILSPYGNFFATEPGAAALVTLPDLDTGERGTCVVWCASMPVDKNADGNMDTYFAGQDVTSQNSPMEAWVNNGHIVPGVDGNLDKDLELPRHAFPNYSSGQITCPRDLENFFRLWICGLPSLPSSQGYSVTLSCNAISGSPAINLYEAETNGGISYLTDTNVAQSLVGENKLGTVSPTNTYTFPDEFFDGSNKYFLFEGAGIGEGQFTLTIYQNGNVIAQTSTYIDLHDIEDFYERAVITENTSGSISNWSSSLDPLQPAIANLTGKDTNLIVFVHGINVGNDDWLDDSGTVLKRLYWAGYHGKFVTVKWPCNYLTPPQPLTLDVFNLSEAKAYKSSTALTTYLEQLRGRFPGYRLNLYVHSQGNAVVSEAVKNGAPFDTYIMTQGAIPDSCYDVDAPTYADFLTQETGTKITPEWQPMGYRGIYTNLTGKIVNFYNPNDPVLATWNEDQIDDKPSGYYSYDGTNCWYTDFFFIKHLVTDLQETRSMVSRARTLSIGQSGPESAHGIIQSAINLNEHFGFNKTFPDDHSAQWTWPIQTTRPYFQQVLISCQIEPAP